jgi:hypothetical protein
MDGTSGGGEDRYHFVLVDSVPTGTFGKNVSRGGIFGKRYIPNRILLKKVLPSWFGVHQL